MTFIFIPGGSGGGLTPQEERLFSLLSKPWHALFGHDWQQSYYGWTGDVQTEEHRWRCDCGAKKTTYGREFFEAMST